MWHSNGQLASVANYKNGKLEGVNRLWHPNGQSQGEIEYKDVVAIRYKYLDENGELVQ